jgi:hypothetical protein
MAQDARGDTGRRGGIDPAALAAASLAAAVSVIAPPGPYGPASIIIGLTMLLVVLGYDIDPDRTRRQSLAFSGVCALISLLVLGYPLEILWATSKLERLLVMLKERTDDHNYSEVPPIFVLSLWLVLTAVFYSFDRRRSALKASQHRSTPRTGGRATKR